jgi:hypothetical protein
MDRIVAALRREPWNRGELVGQKAPLKVKDIWAIRVRLQIQARTRDLALFDLGIDSKLRGCDLVKLRVRDVYHGDRVARGPSCFSRKRNDRSNSRSPLRRARLLRLGSSARRCDPLEIAEQTEV